MPVVKIESIFTVFLNHILEEVKSKIVMRIHGLLLILLFLIISVFGLSNSAIFAGSDKVIVAGFTSDKMERGSPLEWELKKYKGTPIVKLEKVGDEFCLHMISDAESFFGIRKGLEVNVKEYPFLNWKWKAAKLPVGRDVRKTNTDDQAAIQIYIAFTAMGWPKKLNTPVVGYTWDNETPKGSMVASSQPFCSKIRCVVVRNKKDKLGEWYMEKRNLYQDYKELFKDIEGNELPVTIIGIQFSISSQNTVSRAESCIYDVYFSKH
jgi:hypothetical protein